MKNRIARVAENSPAWVNDRLREEAEKRVAGYENASAEQIERRLAELDREWDIERLIETESATMILLGLLIGANFGRKWLVLPLLSASMLIVHNTQGFYPLLPLFRRMGIRSADEIAVERYALKALRGDFRQNENGAEGDQPQRAVAAARS